jgi:peptidoglycan/LPS O-acetylase OafA/YrhL
MTQPANRLLALDGLRGVAAGLVVLLHAGPVLGGVGLVQHAYLMVDLFFLMSGFVLSAAFGERLARGGAGGAFVRARLLRLWPLCLASLLLGLATVLIAQAAGKSIVEAPLLLAAVLAAGFIPWAGGGLISPINGPLWSLQAEMWSNLAWGAVGRHVTTARLAVFTAVMGAALAACALGRGDFDGGFMVRDPGTASGWLDLGMAALRVGFAFPLGILLHRLWREGRLPRPSRPLPPILVPAVLVLVSTVPYGVPPLFDLVVVYLLFPILLMLAVAQSPQGRAAVWSERAGRLSYGLYVMHGPMLVLAKHLTPAEASIGLKLAVCTAAVAASVLLAWAAERWIDRPVRAFVAARSPFSRPTAATASVQLEPVRNA